MTLNRILEYVVKSRGSDLHLSVGIPPVVRIDGSLYDYGDVPLTVDVMAGYVREILGDEYNNYEKNGEADRMLEVQGIGRFRANVYKDRGRDTAALRAVPIKVPTLKELSMPKVIKDFTELRDGLVLITGPTGSGKSTTMAAMINEINMNKRMHIVTLEDPIEYLHNHGKSIINQREIGRDTKTYDSGLRAVLREDPDVILVGEIRDMETLSAVLLAAETGHLVLSTLHTISAYKTIDRIINYYPQEQQMRIRSELASVLRGVVCQRLYKKKDEEGRVAALEILVNTPAVQNLIREGKLHQISSVMETSSKYGMQTMETAVNKLKPYIDLI